MLKQILQDLRKSDAFLVLSLYLLVLIGIIGVASASIEPALRFNVPEYYFLVKHVVAIAGGVAVFILLLYVKKPFYRDPSFLFLLNAVSFTLLILVFFFPARHGVHRWIPLGPFSFQPSELAKLTVILTLSALASDRELLKGRGRFVCLGYVFLYIIPIAFEPDYGAVIFLLLLSMLILFVAGMGMRESIGFALVVLIFIGLVVLYKGSSYVIERLQTFLKGRDLQYQVRQSIAALGAGGLKGVSPGESVQKLLFLPEAYTDFIFAIIGEEWGFMGTTGVILLFLVLLWRGYRISFRVRDPASSLLAFSLTTALFLQALINISVVVGVFPPKGIALPFLSYGGSSTLVSFTMVGLLNFIWVRRRQ